MRQAWRITKSALVSGAFTGDGAAHWGGRWNSVGTHIVYTSGTLAAAALEILVHLSPSRLLAAYSFFEVQFPETLIEAVPLASLPSDWNSNPSPFLLQRIGDAWVAGGRSVVLEVPNAIVPREATYLLNPRHPEFRLINIEPPLPFPIDPRLIR